jgi:hypothetical protein
MRLTMSERRAVVRVATERYRRAGKRQKGQILDELVAVTGYNRWYAVWLLRRQGKTIRGPGRVRLVGDLALQGQTAADGGFTMPYYCHCGRSGRSWIASAASAWRRCCRR